MEKKRKKRANRLEKGVGERREERRKKKKKKKKKKRRERERSRSLYELLCSSSTERKEKREKEKEKRERFALAFWEHRSIDVVMRPISEPDSNPSTFSFFPSPENEPNFHYVLALESLSWSYIRNTGYKNCHTLCEFKILHSTADSFILFFCCWLLLGGQKRGEEEGPKSVGYSLKLVREFGSWKVLILSSSVSSFLERSSSLCSNE